MTVEIISIEEVPSLPARLRPRGGDEPYKVYESVDNAGHHVRWRYKNGRLVAFIRYREIAPGEYRPKDIWEAHVERVKALH